MEQQGIRGQSQAGTTGAWAGPGVALVALAVLAVFSSVVGGVAGSDWARADYGFAQLGAVINVWVWAVLLPFVPAAVVAASDASWRSWGFVAIVVAVTLGLLVGFLSATGYGGEDGFPPDDLMGGVLFVLLLASVSGGLGYGFGTLLRRTSR